MATVSQACIKVPGLNERITDRDYMKSSELYSKLPEILEVSKRDQLSPSILAEIGGLIRENGVGDYIGIHETHSHGRLAEGHVVVGEDFKNPLCRRIQQVPSSTVASLKIYGRLFVLDDDGFLRPYEFQRGTIPQETQELVSKFIPRYIQLVETHNLGNTISLEMLSGTLSQRTSEIVCGSEVTLWEADRVVQQDRARVTGFTFSNEGHSDSSKWVGTSEGHMKIKPPPGSKLPDLHDLEAQLVREGRLMPREPSSHQTLKSLL